MCWIQHSITDIGPGVSWNELIRWAVSTFLRRNWHYMYCSGDMAVPKDMLKAWPSVWSVRELVIFAFYLFTFDIKKLLYFSLLFHSSSILLTTPLQIHKFFLKKTRCYYMNYVYAYTCIISCYNLYLCHIILPAFMFSGLAAGF